MNLYRLGVCLKCRGDLAYDDGDWLCLQCGTYYYTGLYPQNQSVTPEGSGLLLLRQAQDDLLPAQGELRPALNGTGLLDYQAVDEHLAPAAD